MAKEHDRYTPHPKKLPHGTAFFLGLPVGIALWVGIIWLLLKVFGL